MTSGNYRVALLLLATFSFIGCGQSDVEFNTNKVYLRLREADDRFSKQAVQDVVDVMTAMFGTPDDPYLVSAPSLNIGDIINVDRLAYAAGPVTAENFGKGQGLYRQHCAHCHGVTGDGLGPTAQFLNPYPRDFRMGVFKFKSTPVGSKPTDEDLNRIVSQGIAGTAMPAFHAALKKGEIETVIDYVKYLSLRGETERKLIDVQAADSSYEDEASAKEWQAELRSPALLIDDLLADSVDGWRNANSESTEIPERSEVYDPTSPEFSEAELAKSLQRGRDVYYGAGQCFTCHGPTQLGDGQQTDYDKWTKEFHDWTKKDENFKTRMAEYMALGGLKPRNIIPRNLRLGVYRGGRRPIDIFWRVRNGIDGSPMPAANPSVVDDDSVWDVVNYVLSLPYEDLSRPDHETAFARERN